MTTPDGAWHLDRAVADRYSAGSVDHVLAASIEMHLVRCAACRELLTADPVRLDRLWDEIVERIHEPRATWIERLLRSLRVDDSTARLVGATPSLRSSWLTGVVVVLSLAVAVAHQGPVGTVLFMTLAPVLPVAGVALAFGPAVDPAYEVAASTPYSALRLLAVRSAVVVASTCLPALAASLLIPGPTWLGLAWLLPALALTVTTVAAGTRFAPTHVAVVLTSLWVALVIPTFLRSHRLLPAEASAQLTCLALLAAAAATLLARRDALPELLRRTP